MAAVTCFDRRGARSSNESQGVRTAHSLRRPASFSTLCSSSKSRSRISHEWWPCSARGRSSRSRSRNKGKTHGPVAQHEELLGLQDQGWKQKQDYVNGQKWNHGQQLLQKQKREQLQTQSCNSQMDYDD